MKKWLILGLLLGMLVPAAAQRNSDWRKQYEAFRQQRNREFQDFKAKANADFAEFLKQRWKDFRPNAAVDAPIRVVMPKPEQVPPAEPATQPLPQPKPDLDVVRRLADGAEKPAGQTAGGSGTSATSGRNGAGQGANAGSGRGSSANTGGSVSGNASTAASGTALSLDFYGDPLRIPWPRGLAPRLSTVGEEGFGAWWGALGAETEAAADYLAQYAEQHRLNGWGYYQLARKVSEAIYPAERPDERIAMQVFLLSQWRFRARAGVCGNRLVLLLPFREQVYAVPYLLVGAEKYYIYSYGHDRSAGYRTYANDFAEADRVLSLAMDGTMEVGMKSRIEVPRWSALLGETFAPMMNVGNLALEMDYPIVDGEVFYRQGVPADLSDAVLGTLRRKIAGKSETQAVGYLLNLVQNGFEYVTDEEAFGRQKQLFIEESFFYGRNNCKDRVGVFSWLVRELTGLDVIFIRYEGNAASDGVSHITCAVGFRGTVEGDAFQYKGRRYVMCDPTYINAGIGRTMPCYASSKGEIQVYD